ncbi:adenylate cyclase [Coemansia javaensis]|uniref:Adenylate cyclase n=1 Tax=Coemansia javaensis TaxID=2761396 RepID=A0A9W8H820_9FUNG|nr:adenylate cyclase [Coemansia javaensis]
MDGDSVPPAIERFIEYLRIKTVQPEPDYAGCREYLRRQAAELGLGFQAHEYVAGKPVVVLTWAGMEPEAGSVVLNSHTDVVPVFPEFWSHPPFEAARVAVAGSGGDYRIIARGAQDMKIVGHCYLEAIRALRARGERVRRTVHAVFVPDEEIGGADGMARFVESREFAGLNAAFALDEGIASPGDGLRVFYGERAPCWARFVAHGQTGHGSQFIADTAAEKLVPVIDRLMALRREQLADFRTPNADGSAKTLGDVTTVNLTMLQSGVQHNVVPESASACFDIRMTPTSDYRAFRRWLEALAAEHGAQLELVQFWDDNTVTPTDASNPFWVAFEAAVAAQGIAIEREIFPAATDSRYLRRAGVPALGVTPLRNTPILLHDHNEYVLQSDVLNGIAFYERVLAAVANVPGP